MNLFRIEGLAFAYGDRTVLDIPDLDIEEEGIVCLTGANGSGKSTLLDLLSGLTPPTAGKILYRGQAFSPSDRNFQERSRSEMGICMQSPYLFRTTVEKNVSYGLTARGFRGPEKDRRTEKALAEVGLEGFGKRPWHALSGGEIQRVALARALVLEPRVLLLDEPMANVDSATRVLLEKVLENLIRLKGITVILSTHDADQALRLGSRIVTLHEGKVVEGGLENVFHGILKEGEDGWVFDTGRSRLFVLPQKGDARTAIVPPEAIILSLDPKETSARNVLKGAITGIRMRNGSVDVAVRAGEEFTSRITPASLEKLGLRLGMEVCLLIKAGAVRVL